MSYKPHFINNINTFISKDIKSTYNADICDALVQQSNKDNLSINEQALLYAIEVLTINHNKYNDEINNRLKILENQIEKTNIKKIIISNDQYDENRQRSYTI